MSEAATEDRQKVLSSTYALLIGQSVELTHIASTTLGEGNTGNRAIQILLAIHADPGASPSKLADRLGLARSAVARAISTLEDRGLVLRRSDRQDRRVMHLTITDAGRGRIELFERELARYFGSVAPSVQELLDAWQGERLVLAKGHVAPLAAASALASTGGAYVQDVQAALEPFGISHAADRFAISLLNERKGLQPVQLARALRLTTGGVSQLVDRLEARNLVRRTHLSGGDRRAVVITLTDRGDEAAAVMLDALDAHAPAIREALALITRVEQIPGAA